MSRPYLLVVSILLGWTVQTTWTRAEPPSCATCLRVRVGIPRVVRGPSSDIPDNRFTVAKLPNGRFRGFAANATTVAIDGNSPADMGGPTTPVLRPAPHGTVGESGEWINHVDTVNGTLMAWVHDETGDKPGMGLKSMSVAVSRNEGASWQRLGQIITGTDTLTRGQITGEGDCTAVDGNDGYYYAYCYRPRDHATIVARAPADNPGPHQWKKWYDGAWSQPGIGGLATKLNANAAAVGRVTATNQMVGIGKLGDDIGLYLSSDHVTFIPLPEPLLPESPGSWKRPDPNEFFAYFSLMDPATGANQLASKWLLSYLYIQPNEGFGKRYLVIRPVDVTITPVPQSPIVGVALGSYVGSNGAERWSTTAAIPPKTGYRLESQLGFLMTAPVAGKPTAEVEDCAKGAGDAAAHLIALKGECVRQGYARLRRQGFVYTHKQSDTQPLYQCRVSLSYFASNRADCEAKGRMVTLLGYDLIH